MSEYSEVIRNKERMCNSFSDCSSCRLSKRHNYCEGCVSPNSEETEKIIMDWAKEHPLITNREKFNEVFGAEVGADVSKTKCPFICSRQASCTDCPYDNFWDMEYKEPKGAEE